MDAIGEQPGATAGLEETLDLTGLTSSIGYALRRAQLLVFADFHARCGCEDIRPAQFAVLQVLHRNPGSRPRDLSAALGIQRTNFVPLFDSLERRNLAERRPVPADRRAASLWLTEPGAALLARLEAILARHEALFEARLGGPAAKADFLAHLARLATGGSPRRPVPRGC